MASVSVFNMEGSEVGTMDLDDAVFGVDINEHLMHMSVVQYLADQRQGTQKAKTRSEVRGGGRKPWRQKGTGHARQGSIRAPQWKGGGMVFAPVPRDYSFRLNKKEKRAAIRSALTSRVVDEKLIVLEDFTVDEIKTKKVKGVLDALNVNKALILSGTIDRNLLLSARNIPNVKVAHFALDKDAEGNTTVRSDINVYDILKYSTLIATKDAVTQLQEVYA